MRKWLWVGLLALACAEPTTPQCHPRQEAIVDPGDLSVLHEFRDANPGASCEAILWRVHAEGHTVVYLCDVLC